MGNMLKVLFGLSAIGWCLGASAFQTKLLDARFGAPTVNNHTSLNSYSSIGDIIFDINDGNFYGYAGSNSWKALSSSSAPAYNYTSQTTGYSASIGDWVVCSGTSFAVTLPTAVGNTGQTLVIQHSGTSITQAYTLNTASSQTIGGVAGGSYVLYTNGEILTVISDGSNWQILHHQTNTAWSSYTPTFTGFGTTTGVSFLSRRVGDSLQVRGKFTAGTTTATTAQVTVGLGSASATIDTTKVPTSSVVGVVTQNGNGSSYYGAYALAPSSNQTYVNMGAQGSTQAAQTTINGNFWSSSTVLQMDFTVPISGWQP